jgi:anti-anti-sigma regulatory factor
MPTATSVEALAAGDHACLTFSDPDERLDIVAAFVRDGLVRSSKVVCLTESVAPDRLTAELVDRGVPAPDTLPPHQLLIFSSEETWLAGGASAATSMIKMVERHLDDARREGFTGLRITADMCWISRPAAAADQLPVFESAVGALFEGGRLAAICQYDREIFDAVTLALATSTHSHTVAATAYYEDPVLRICRQHSPPGIRLAGEIDFNRVEEFTVALAEAVRLDQDIQINLAKLRFLDVACATAIAHAAIGLPAGRVMSIVCGDPVERVLRLVGVTSIAAVRVVRTHGEH